MVTTIYSTNNGNNRDQKNIDDFGYNVEPAIIPLLHLYVQVEAEYGNPKQ